MISNNKKNNLNNMLVGWFGQNENIVGTSYKYCFLDGVKIAVENNISSTKKIKNSIANNNAPFKTNEKNYNKYLISLGDAIRNFETEIEGNIFSISDIDGRKGYIQNIFDEFNRCFERGKGMSKKISEEEENIKSGFEEFQIRIYKIQSQLLKVFLQNFEKKYAKYLEQDNVAPKKENLQYPKLKWNGNQKQLAELVIELQRNGWVADINKDENYLIEVVKNICNLFDLSETAKKKDSDTTNSFYQILKGEVDEGNSKKRNYPQVYSPQYKKKFATIKARKI